MGLLLVLEVTYAFMLAGGKWCVTIIIVSKVHLQRVQLCLEDQHHQGVQSSPGREQEQRQANQDHQSSVCLYKCFKEAGTRHYGKINLHLWLKRATVQHLLIKIRTKVEYIGERTSCYSCLSAGFLYTGSVVMVKIGTITWVHYEAWTAFHCKTCNTDVQWVISGYEKERLFLVGSFARFVE